MSIVASNVKRIIAEKGYKQKAIAEKAGYTETIFSNMLNGRKMISERDISILILVLEVSPNDLFMHTAQPA